MPPRIRTCTNRSATRGLCKGPRSQRPYATVSAITPAVSLEQMTHASRPLARHPSTQPPSLKPPELRKSQLLRQYASLLRSSPLLLIFQHNNIKANEWVGIRRELNAALRKIDEARAADGHYDGIGNSAKIQIIQSGVFSAALKVVEFFKPEIHQSAPSTHPANDPSTSSSTNPSAQKPTLTHALSKEAREAVRKSRRKHALQPLLSGPLVVLSFPSSEPSYLKAALQVLSPQAPAFPAPTRRANPGWHDSAVQGGLQKLMLLGARVEGKTFDVDKTRWVGGIEGGLEGLRARLVQVLQGVGAGVTGTLEAASRSLYLTVEGRRMMLEDNIKDPAAGKGVEAKAE